MEFKIGILAKIRDPGPGRLEQDKRLDSRLEAALLSRFDGKLIEGDPCRGPGACAIRLLSRGDPCGGAGCSMDRGLPYARTGGSPEGCAYS